MCARNSCVMFKKKALFYFILLAVFFSSVFVVLSTFYVCLIENEWEDAECKIRNYEWQDNLYQSTPIASMEGKSSLEIPTNETAGGNYKIIRIPGWMYSVKIKYKDTTFDGTIKDPASLRFKRRMPLYEKNGVYHCILLLEKLRPEETLFPNIFSKQGNLAKEDESDPDNTTSSVVKDAMLLDESGVYFVVSVVWARTDLFIENHQKEKAIRISLTVVAWIMIVITVYMFHIYYKHYYKDKSDIYTPKMG